MLLALLPACEIGFWVFLLAGLVTRYLFRARRAGLVVLVLAPCVDLVLLAATAASLRNGGVATWSHGLAALYLGFSVAYGHRLIAWADVRFAHRFAGGPAPRRLYGTDYTRACWSDVLRTTVAAVVAAVILLTIWPRKPKSVSGQQQRNQTSVH